MQNSSLTISNNSLQSYSNVHLLPWVVCLSGALFFFYEFIQINMFNSIASGILKTFSPTTTQLGFLSASYFYGNILFLFPAGLFLDRFNTKKLLVLMMSISVSGTFLFCLSHSVLLAALGRFISGAAGSSFCFLGSIRLASRWFPPHRMAMVTGVIVTLAMLGGIIAQTPLSLLAQKIGWQDAVFFLGCIGILIIMILMIFVKNSPMKPDIITTKTTSKKVLFYILQVLSNRQNWLCGLYTCLLNLPILLLGALWGNLYLTKIHHLLPTQASFVITMLYVGTIIGAPLVGWISDSIGLRRLPMFLGALLSLLTILAIILLPNLSYEALVISFLLLGFFSSAQCISYPIIAESNTTILTASAVGFANIIVMSGGAIFQPIFGWLLRLHEMAVPFENSFIYLKDDFFIAMIILPLAMVVSLSCIFLIKETHCKASY